MHPYDLNPGPDSLRWLEMAEKLLTTRDLIGSKSFATKALESDPNSEAAEQILAIVDTLIAGDKQTSTNHLDWYSILQLARRTHDSELIGLQYKRLGVLLNPNRNKYPFAEHAYKLVTEAWLVLSNPSRKFQFDNEFGNSNSTHFNFIQTHFETPQQQSHRISGGSSGMQFDFMQEGSGGQLHQSSPMQFVQQQQQQVFAPQARPFFSEEQQQQHAQSLSNQLHWSNQGKQPLVRPQPQQPLVRPQLQQPLLRPHSQQTWFQQPEPQTHIQHPLPQAQPHIQQQPQPQPQQPSHWAQSLPQSQPQSQPKKPLPESREQSTQPLHWAQLVPQHPHLSQPEAQSWMQQALPRPQIQQPLTEPRPQPPPEFLEQPQQPLHSSQLVSQLPQQPQQPRMQQSLPSPQIQTSSPEPQPQPQPQKTPPESREGVNNGEQFSLDENGETDDNHENNINVEEPSNFWTVCAYCYSMYEYSGIYADCTLRCQNCKKAFHAVKTETPPAVSDGEDAYIYCWGYFPIGISMSYMEKRKAEASSWQPFSKMFTIPRGGNTSAFPQGGTEFNFPQGGNTSKPRNHWNSGPRIYIDDDEEEDIFYGILSDEESDDDDWRYPPKNKKAKKKKAKSSTRKVSSAIKVKQPQALAEMAQYSNTGNLHSGVVAQDGAGVSGPDVEVPIVPDAAVPIVPEPAVLSVPVPKAAMDDADKKVVETSKKNVSVPIRKQPGRAAKDLGKLDGVVAQEGSGASLPDVAEVSFTPTNQPKDCGKPDEVDGVIAQEGLCVSVSDTTVVSVPKRKLPGRVAKDLGKLDVGDAVVAEEGSGVSVPEVAEVSVPAGKQPVRISKDLGKLDGVDVAVAQGGLGVSIPDVAPVSVPARKQPGRVAKDSGKLDGVGAQVGLGVIVSDSPVVSVTPKKQPGRLPKDLGKLDGVIAQEGMSVSVPNVSAPSVPVAEANKKVIGEAEKKAAAAGSSKKRAYVPTRKQPGRVAKDLGKLDLNVEFNNEVEGPARGTSGGSKAVNGAEENVDGVAFFEGLDEYLSSLPILSADAGGKAKAV